MLQTDRREMGEQCFSSVHSTTDSAVDMEKPFGFQGNDDSRIGATVGCQTRTVAQRLMGLARLATGSEQAGASWREGAKIHYQIDQLEALLGHGNHLEARDSKDEYQRTRFDARDTAVPDDNSRATAIKGTRHEISKGKFWHGQLSENMVDTIQQNLAQLIAEFEQRRDEAIQICTLASENCNELSRTVSFRDKQLCLL
ncbi:hypothetical protein KEM55_007470 [Ascosphaera atra]|nr:hypothetical protein KEM55_007470 [Ascosphaera atra]